MTDAFESYQTGLESPAVRLIPVTPSDTEDLTEASRAINVASDGALRVTTIGGTTATIHVAAGIAFPIRVSRVWSTGTTASGIVALA
ncbi:hypothetical protein [uncultured Roseobacter sp.]|uniref:spike base protein, RCAP_Rcc01079 family n=1 Tax=uncultured Roseobacter sp. TaxID=114847 RepID=UPI002602A1B2|nr:hypothetical protein [uncultured Roseobacter sp.]